MAANINPAIAGLTPYQPGKPLDELARELGIEDAVKLASNENPRGPGRGVRRALEGGFAELSRYPDGSGHRLKSALSEHLGVAPERITLGNGSNDVLELAARVALSPGSRGICDEHAFVVYPLAIIAAGGELRRIPAQEYGHDLDAFAAAIDAITRVVFIANPNNPTGAWVDERALVRFLDAVPPAVWVVLDEAYAEYVTNPGYPDGVRLTERYDNLMVTRTFSKVHGLASLRVGYGVSSPELADLLNRVRQPFNVNSLALAAAEAALADTEYIAESRRLNDEGMAQIEAGLSALGLGWIPSVGNFVTVDVGREAGGVYDALLRRGVIVRPVANYGLPNHLRVTVGLPDENRRFLEALAEVL